MHWLAHVFGFADNEGNQAPYLFWSGFFSDAPIVAALGIFAWHHNCAEPGCWRIGKAHRNHRCKRHAKEN